MWHCHAIPYQNDISAINRISATQSYHLCFCNNGLVFCSQNVSIYFQREDMLDYTIYSPATFVVTNNSPMPPFTLGTRGLDIMVTEKDKVYTMNIEGSGQEVSMIVKNFIHAPSPNVKYLSDNLLRTINYLAEIDSKAEYKQEGIIVIPNRLGTSQIKLSINASDGIFKVYFNESEISSRVYFGQEIAK